MGKDNFPSFHNFYYESVSNRNQIILLINIDKGIFLLSTSYYFVDILKPNKSNHITTISNHSKILKVITGIGTNSIISISSPHHRRGEYSVFFRRESREFLFEWLRPQTQKYFIIKIIIAMNFETFASSILAIQIYYILCSTFYMQYKSEVPDDDKTTAGSTSRPPQTSQAKMMVFLFGSHKQMMDLKVVQQKSSGEVARSKNTRSTGLPLSCSLKIFQNY